MDSQAIHNFLLSEVSAVYSEVSSLADVKIRLPEQTLHNYPPAEYLREIFAGTVNNFQDLETRLGTDQARKSFLLSWNAIAQKVSEEVLFLYIPQRRSDYFQSIFVLPRGMGHESGRIMGNHCYFLIIVTLILVS